MGIREYTKLFTRIAFVLGLFAVLSCFFTSLLLYGMMCSILGSVIAIIIISIRTHYSVPTKWRHPSIISLVLCSAPVLYVLILIYLNKA